MLAAIPICDGFVEDGERLLIVEVWEVEDGCVIDFTVSEVLNDGQTQWITVPEDQLERFAAIADERYRGHVECAFVD